jgi:hypothetical protein
MNYCDRLMFLFIDVGFPQVFVDSWFVLKLSSLAEGSCPVAWQG